jgi:DNA replication and repair protein RecF
MLRLQKIALTQFKNYPAFEIGFDRQVVGICGANGVGKTSLLDAIHYLGLTKSYFSRHDEQAVQTGCSGFRIEGLLQLGQIRTEITCILRENGKKEFASNGTIYERLSLHIGKIPVVVIAPDDAVLVTGESKERRLFIDQLLAQIDPDYLQRLIRYNRHLLQRNALLKDPAISTTSSRALLDVMDDQLAAEGQFIYESRAAFLSSFIPLVIEQYHSIATSEHSPTRETISVSYQSHLQQASLDSLLRTNRQADLSAQRTTKGIHRDELVVTMLDQPFKQLASQGQRKSLLFALKLAQADVIKQKKGFAPLLLLDDVFEKLDENRIENLLRKVCTTSGSQVFITDTSADRLDRQLSKLEVPFQLVSL